MVHIRAKNLPEKGRVLKWLYNSQMVKKDDDFALIELESSQQVIIKSHVDCFVVRTIKLGTVVKNGTIIANVAVGSKDIGKHKNRNYVEGEEPINIELESLEIATDGLENLVSAEDELDEINEASVIETGFISSKNYSSSNDYRNMEFRDDNNNGSGNSPGKNRFAEMRANIAKSIQNAPNLNNNKLSEQERDKLSGMSNNEAASSGNLFSTDNSSGVSKFRQLVQSRKEKLMEENDFQEVNVNDQPVDAMSKLDDKGRPLIMRNIIAGRLEKFNASGGDPNAVNSMVHEQEQNNGKKVLKASSILMDGNPKYIKQDPETPSMFKAKERILSNHSEDSPFMRQKNSDDGDFRPTFGAYVDDEEYLELDSNDLANSGAMVMPHKRADEIYSELSKKPEKSYAELKLSNLYDTNRRLELFQSRNEVAQINKRKHMVEQGTLGNYNDLASTERVQPLKINGIDVPVKFLKEVSVKKNDGGIKRIPYKDTTVGHNEFEDWLKINNLFHAWKVQQNRQKSYGNLNSQNNKMQDQIDELQNTITFQVDELKNEVEIDNEELINSKDAKVLFKEIKDLKKELEKTKKEQSKVAPEGEGTFTQMMQLFMMQNMMNNKNNYSSNNPADISTSLKYVIKDELESFKKQIAEENQKERQLLIEKEKRIFLEKEKEAKLLLSRETAKLIEKDKRRESLLNHQTEKIIKAEKERAILLQKEKERLIQKEKELEILRANLEGINLSNNKNLANLLGPETSNKKRNENFEKKPKREFNNKNYNYNQGKNQNSSDGNTKRKPLNPKSNKAVNSMIMSKNHIPPLTIGTEVDMTAILKLKHVLKKQDGENSYPTILFIAKAISLALSEYPKINSSYDAERNEVIEKGYHNIGLATEITDGLIIPVLKNVEKLSLKNLAIDIQKITILLRSGELYNYETSGSTITLANYGNIGVIQATPTIFHPNAAVVGVGKVVKKPIVVDNEKLAIKAIMNISLTVDQRIIDNTTAGNFLAKIKEILEKPDALVKS